MTLDDSKTQTPEEYFDIKEQQCSFCGTPSDKYYCSRGCCIADLND